MNHPHGWLAIQTRPLAKGEVFDICGWMRGMTTEDYDMTPSPEPDTLTIYFAEKSNAVFFQTSMGRGLDFLAGPAGHSLALHSSPQPILMLPTPFHTEPR